jgi:hypothetical protein
MKNLIVIAALLIGFQANAIYADKLIPMYSCKMVQPIPDATVRLVLTQSPISKVVILNTYSSLFTGEQHQSFMVQPQISIASQETFSNNQVNLTIQLTEELQDGSMPAVFVDERGAAIEMGCSPVRSVLRM